MATSSTKGKRRITFEFRADSGTNVFVAGTFNDWDSTQKKLTRKNGSYKAIMMLPKGRYEYKFLVNGKWCVDPECPEWVTNGVGSLNSVLVVD